MSDAPYTQVNEARPKYERGWFVLDVPTGRVGAVIGRLPKSPFSKDTQYKIMFASRDNAVGIRLRLHRQLLLATKDQVSKSRCGLR